MSRINKSVSTVSSSSSSSKSLSYSLSSKNSFRHDALKVTRVRAVNPIAKGDELFLNYGGEYKIADEAVGLAAQLASSKTLLAKQAAEIIALKASLLTCVTI